MAKSISLRCQCGAVRGSTRPLSARSGTHIICYCDDCRAYLQILERSELLDAAGGTEIFQMAPGDLALTQGIEQVRCMRLSEKGMHRFYTACCRTPIGNTLGARVPFMGVVHAFMDGTREEREALQILALAGGGRTEEARSYAKRFRTSYPQSVFLPQIEQATQ